MEPPVPLSSTEILLNKKGRRVDHSHGAPRLNLRSSDLQEIVSDAAFGYLPDILR
jgi:hypothetical protein